MSLDATTLKQNWLAIFPGPQQELAVSIAASTSGAYVALDYGSPKFTFGKTSMPDAPNPSFVGAIGAVDANGAPIQAIFATSVNNATYVKVIVDAKNLYAVGQFQGATTFDDGTMATGSLTESNAVVIRDSVTPSCDR